MLFKGNLFWRNVLMIGISLISFNLPLLELFLNALRMASTILGLCKISLSSCCSTVRFARSSVIAGSKIIFYILAREYILENLNFDRIPILTRKVLGTFDKLGKEQFIFVGTCFFHRSYNLLRSISKLH